MRKSLLVALFLAFAQWLHGAEPRPNVILITLDTVRADRMGFLGSTAKLTPNLDLLAKDALVFPRTYSQAPLTTVSHASILTGTYPQFHGVWDFAKPLPTTIPALAPLLKEHGYRTAAFVGSMILDPKTLAPGFDRGFDTYDAGYRMRRAGKESRYGSMERRAFDVIDRVTNWLQSSSRQPGPFFLWVHLFDAHDPYEPPPPYDQRGSSKYEGEIAYVDAAVGRFLTTLKKSNLYAGSMIVVASDHGEALGDHGEQTHGIFLYDETIHVPLVIKWPGSKRAPQGVDVKQRAQLIDIAPTILKEIGLGVPQSMQGRDLLAASTEERPAYAETDYPRRAFGWSDLAAIRSSKYLFVRAPERELYDVQRDPKEAQNLAPKSPAVSDTLAAQLGELRRSTQAADTQAKQSPISPEQRQQLAALGYVGESVNVDTAKAGVDPKGKITVANNVQQAIRYIEDGEFGRAVPLLESAVQQDPQIYTAQYQLGLAYARQRKYADAIPHLKAALVVQPDSAFAQYELGLALFETGDLAGASPYFEATVRALPQWPEAHFALGSVYVRTDRVRDGLDELQAALQLDPDHVRANVLAGRVLSLQGRPDVGVTLLERAVMLQADNQEAHAFLADAYRKLGRAAEAAEQERRARQLAPTKAQ